MIKHQHAALTPLSSLHGCLHLFLLLLLLLPSVSLSRLINLSASSLFSPSSSYLISLSPSFTPALLPFLPYPTPYLPPPSSNCHQVFIDEQSGGCKNLLNLLPRRRTHLSPHLHNSKTD